MRLRTKRGARKHVRTCAAEAYQALAGIRPRKGKGPKKGHRFRWTLFRVT